MIKVTSKGNFDNTEEYLKKMLKGDLYSDLDQYGEMGVQALSDATPEETGVTAASWAYRIEKSSTRVAIEWYNTNEAANGVPIVILIQYGHGTGTGGYVVGHDFINPAMRSIFERISDEIGKKVRA